MTTFEALRSSELPSREEVVRMLKTPAVLITAILVGGVVALVLLGVVGFLVWQSKDAKDVISLVQMLVTGYLMVQNARLRADVGAIKAQTNGTQTKLIDHALSRGDQPQ